MVLVKVHNLKNLGTPDMSYSLALISGGLSNASKKS